MLQRRWNTCMKRPLQAHPGIAQKKETRILSPEEDLWRHQADKLGICSSCWPLHLLSSPCWYKMVVKWRWIWCLSSFEEGISWRGLFLTPSELNMKCSYVLCVTLFFFFFFHNSQLHNIVAHSCFGRVWFSRCHLPTYSHTYDWRCVPMVCF